MISAGVFLFYCTYMVQSLCHTQSISAINIKDKMIISRSLYRWFPYPKLIAGQLTGLPESYFLNKTAPLFQIRCADGTKPLTWSSKTSV